MSLTNHDIMRISEKLKLPIDKKFAIRGTVNDRIDISVCIQSFYQYRLQLLCITCLKTKT